MATNPLAPDFSEVVSSFKNDVDDRRLQTAIRLLEEVRGSVVKVIAGGHACDGFFIEDGTKIVTSNELFQTSGAENAIEIQTSTGALLKGKIESQDNRHEEVVVNLEGVKPNTYRGLKLGSTDDLELREDVYLYGHNTDIFNDPRKKPILAIGSLQTRYVASAQEFGDEEGEKKSSKHHFLDCSMPQNVGMSGSPLLNQAGEVIGMYQQETPTLPSKSKNVLVICDDVSELKEILPVAEADDKPAAEADHKPTAKQLEAIEAKFGKITKPTVIDFSADWCPACQKLEPVLDKAEKENGDAMKVVRINYDKDKDLARAFGVQALPTIIYIGVSPDGEILYQDQSVGFSKDNFQQHIDQLMKDRK